VLSKNVRSSLSSDGTPDDIVRSAMGFDPIGYTGVEVLATSIVPEVVAVIPSAA